MGPRRAQRALYLVLVVLLAPLSAAAVEVPGIDGHMTDPQRRLGSSKSSIEEKLTKLQDETHFDVAGWVTGAPEDQVETLGREAYERWGIGKSWENGVFLAFPAAGHVHILQDPAKPLLSGDALAKVMAVDEPGQTLPTRVDKLIEEVRKIVVPLTQNHVLPPGKAHPEGGRKYVIGACALLLLAALMSFARKAPSPQA